MRDFRPRPEKEPEIPNDGLVAWLALIAMGMALGFMFGYGLLYT